MDYTNYGTIYIYNSSSHIYYNFRIYLIIITKFFIYY